MKFKHLAAAGAIALASTGSFAAYGDIVFTDSFSGTFNSMGAGSVTADFGSLAAGKYNFEASVTSTGNISVGNGAFNSDSLGNLTSKIVYGTGTFSGGVKSSAYRGWALRIDSSCCCSSSVSSSNAKSAMR